MSVREWHPPALLKPFLQLAPLGFPRQIPMILGENEQAFSKKVQKALEKLEQEGRLFNRKVIQPDTPRANADGKDARRIPSLWPLARPVPAGYNMRQVIEIHPGDIDLPS